MSQQLQEQLTQLAVKLNVSVDVLYGALLKQAKLVAVEDSIIVLLAFILFPVATHYIKKCIKEKAEAGSWNGEGWVILGTTISALYLILFCFALCDLFELINCTFNPNFWILSQIIGSH